MRECYTKKNTFFVQKTKIIARSWRVIFFFFSCLCVEKKVFRGSFVRELLITFFQQKKSFLTARAKKNNDLIIARGLGLFYTCEKCQREMILSMATVKILTGSKTFLYCTVVGLELIFSDKKSNRNKVSFCFSQPWE